MRPLLLLPIPRRFSVVILTASLFATARAASVVPGRPCTEYALTGQALPLPIRQAVQQHAADKSKLLQGTNVVTLEKVFWVTKQREFADCVLSNGLKTFRSAPEAERWWEHVGTGSVLRGADGRLDALFLNGDSLARDLSPYFQAPRLHLEVVYELSALMEYFDAVIATQNPSHDPDRGLAFPAQLKLLRIYERNGKVPPEAVAKVEETYTVASLNGKHRTPATGHVATGLLPANTPRN